jgi:hypothetical protein
MKYELEICDPNFQMWFWQVPPQNEMNRLLSIQNTTQYRISLIMQEEEAMKNSNSSLYYLLIGNLIILLLAVGIAQLAQSICLNIASALFQILNSIFKVIFWIICLTLFKFPRWLVIFLYSFKYSRLARNLLKAMIMNFVVLGVFGFLLSLSLIQAGLFSMMLSNYIPNIESVFWGGSSYNTHQELGMGIGNSLESFGSSQTSAAIWISSLGARYSNSFILSAILIGSVFINLIALVNLLAQLINYCKKSQKRQDQEYRLPENTFVPQPI